MQKVKVQILPPQPKPGLGQQRALPFRRLQLQVVRRSQIPRTISYLSDLRPKSIEASLQLIFTDNLLRRFTRTMALHELSVEGCPLRNPLRTRNSQSICSPVYPPFIIRSQDYD